MYTLGDIREVHHARGWGVGAGGQGRRYGALHGVWCLGDRYVSYKKISRLAADIRPLFYLNYESMQTCN